MGFSIQVFAVFIIDYWFGNLLVCQGGEKLTL